MPAVTALLPSVFLLALAGLLHGGLDQSNDPELLMAGVYVCAGLGLIGPIAFGVALGMVPPRAR